ncbi:MAG: ArsR family transcriptional regulator [Halapricum sp.]
MIPESETPNAGAASEEVPSDDFDTWRALQKATDKKRADILADIVGHPKGTPSVEELDYMNPKLSDDAIRRHLQTLIEVGVVQELEVEKGERVRDFPRKFYAITDEARDLFDRNGLFPEAAWKRQYKSVKKTQRIREVETMPRPES